MNITDNKALIKKNKMQYSNIYNQLHFVTPEKSAHASAYRKTILQSISNDIQPAYNQSKFYIGSLSPGCKLCGSGHWSCLFINGKCNGNCFYCPTEQNSMDIPTTNTIDFSNSKKYVAYLQLFGFKGASISGGEPFLTYDKSIEFIKNIRKQTNTEFYIWLYSNGILSTSDNLKRLSDAGVNEIRFNIGATNYRLEHVKKAVGIIKTVTVEIPAIPEELNRLKNLTQQLSDAGVNHLNLHQLRLTPYNFKHLRKRDYTYLHGEKITVLESELTALEIMQHTVKQNTALSVNYCSFVYKNRFQKAGYRTRFALSIKKSYEDITENGYIRNMQITGEHASILLQVKNLQTKSPEATHWFYKTGTNCLLFCDALWNAIDFSNSKLLIQYSEAVLKTSVSYQYPFTRFKLYKNSEVIIERKTANQHITLTGDEVHFYHKHYIENKTSSTQAEQNAPNWQKIATYEKIPSGLQYYF